MGAVERTESIQAEPAVAFARLLGVTVPDFDGGAALPLTWHWLYLLERPYQSDLGDDGHPTTGAVPEPPGRGLRRMWAGGSLHLRGHLHVGHEATRRSTVIGSERKAGRSGPFTIVTVRHEIIQRGEIVVEERQELVYRARALVEASDSVASATTRVLPSEAQDWEIPISPTLLFRYSALTYNAHRIHYDRDYARQVEGYPGLVVHGPLQAMAMAEYLRRNRIATGPGTVFTYRLVSPLFEDQGMRVTASQEAGEVTTQVCDASGRLTARGTVTRDTHGTPTCSSTPT
ncbi:MAG: MaoC family dehydratase N-terminal domain-containing protein [Actinobacteria bacterium]|nr:MaoC family dehydratase N-terminal domain-containing protein [Actinomycetota bacterium]